MRTKKYVTGLSVSGWKRKDNDTLTLILTDEGQEVWGWELVDSAGYGWQGSVTATEGTVARQALEAIASNLHVMKDRTRWTAVRRLLRYENKGALEQWKV